MVSPLSLVSFVTLVSPVSRPNYNVSIVPGISMHAVSPVSVSLVFLVSMVSPVSLSSVLCDSSVPNVSSVLVSQETPCRVLVWWKQHQEQRRLETLETPASGDTGDTRNTRD